ncbi:MAPEG family protein [Roseibium sp. Sym1]|uniref:MAPEG family protein n=1 Tax=Roseibium sp. Sym1 TaxID=3016006 RepID=UPI0022B42A7A|nr:MAPEG family protein [Roseibium sp. Sym1]
MQLSQKQTSVFKGMAAALLVSGLALAAGAFLLPAGLPAEAGTGGRLELLAICTLAISVWLLASIGVLARHRFFTPEDIDGSGLTSGSAEASVLQAVLQNTLEQTVLAASVYGCFAILAPAHYLGALPAAAGLFWIGRALFWHGYAKGAGGRAFGFALTFYSTVLLLITTVVMALI